MYLMLTELSGLVMGINFFFAQLGDLHSRLIGAHLWLGSVGWFAEYSYKMQLFLKTKNFQ